MWIVEAACPLDAAAAPVQKSGKVGDLRFPGRSPQDGPALGHRQRPAASVSVAPTLGKRRVISAPCRPDGAVSTSRPSPASSSTAPIFASPARCRSMGRAPMRQPPGRLKSRPGPAVPAAARRTGWRPAFVPLFAPGKGAVSRADRRRTASLPPATGRHSPRPAEAPMQCIPRPTRRGTAWSRTGLPCRAAMPQKAAERCFSPPELPPLPFSGRPPCHPRSVRSAVSCPLPPFRKRYPTVCKTGPECEADKFVWQFHSILALVRRFAASTGLLAPQHPLRAKPLRLRPCWPTAPTTPPSFRRRRWSSSLPPKGQSLWQFNFMFLLLPSGLTS